MKRWPGLGGVAWRLPSRRVLAIAGGALALVGLLAAGGWLWTMAQQARSATAYGAVLARIPSARASGGTPDARAAAIRDLEAVLGQYPSAARAAEANWELGNLRFAERDWARARAAWEMVIERGRSPTLVTLAQAGIGYAWEAEGKFPQAIEAFEVALARIHPADFYWDELTLALGRVQEHAGKKDAAIATYRKFLKESLRSPRADDARRRLAALGVAP